MLKILLVEDNRGDQRLFQETLKETGIECRLIMASNGKDGIELVKKEKPDLLVLDVLMPGMIGYDVCHALRFGPDPEKDMPILLLTGRKEEIDHRFLRMMKVYYMQKPYKMEELKDMIQNLCQGKLC